MEAWLKAAIDYVPRWLDYQLRVTRQPGCCDFTAGHCYGHYGESGYALVAEAAEGVLRETGALDARDARDSGSQTVVR